MTTVYFDIDTQLDFVYPAGALYVPGAEAIVARVAALNAAAVARSIPLVSTMDAHAEDDVEFRLWPPHCVVGSLGQRKPGATLVARSAVVPGGPGAAPAFDAPQILVEKQTVDAFSNPHFAAMLGALGAARSVVYGVAAEICVRHAAFGLLKTGREVAIVEDAVRGLKKQDELEMFEAFRAAGGRVIALADCLG